MPTDTTAETHEHNGHTERHDRAHRSTTSPDRVRRSSFNIHTSLVQQIKDATDRRYPGYGVSNVNAISALILVGSQLWEQAGSGDLRGMLHPDNREQRGEQTTPVKITPDAYRAMVAVADELEPSTPGRFSVVANRLIRLALQAQADEPPAPPLFDTDGGQP